MPKAVRDLAIGVGGGLIVILITVIWSWISAGGLVRVLGGASQFQLAAISTQLEQAQAERGAVDKFLGNAIVLTDRICADLGPDWKRYEAVGGRFPLGAGETKDARGEQRKLTLGDRDGAYLHSLSRAEMARHEHQILEYESENRTPRRRMRLFIRESPKDNDRVTGYDDRKMASVMSVYHLPDQYNTDRRLIADPDAQAKSGAHNNMPPYVVMNFCYKDS